MQPRKTSGKGPRKGTSALILAVENGHFDLALTLLEAGADPNDQRSGFTALHALEVRNAFNRNGGNLGENGCVDWLFEAKGIIEMELKGHDPDELSLEALDLGADDVDPVGPDDETLTIYTDPSDLERIRQALEAKKYEVVKAESTMLPKTRIEINEEKVAHQVMRLVEKLEDLDDVQNVYTNADFPEAFVASFEG